MRALAFVLVLCPALVAHAASTVAVLPFNDLSSSSGTVGEAIRETVTSDLKELSELRVIERARIDAVLAEQRLQERRADLDLATAAKLGRLLGANLMVTGAYQKVGPDVRLTARFVRVETGEIVGTAKVDGKAAEFLTLQDKVTTALLRSLGVTPTTVARMSARPRPKIRSVRTIELYGDAVVQPDPEARKKLLESTLAEEPGFTYAARDLDALRERLAGYDAKARLAGDKLIEEELRAVRRERDPDKLNMRYVQVLGRLTVARRFRRLLATCEALVKAAPPRPRNASVPWVVEYARYSIVLSHSVLREVDATLREGEGFLRDYKTSIWFDGVRGLVDQAIYTKRERADGEAAGAAALTAMSPEQRADPCKTYFKYGRAYEPLRRDLVACIARGGDPMLPAAMMQRTLMQSCQELGDFAGARAALDRIKVLDPKAYEMEAQMSRHFPVDD